LLSGKTGAWENIKRSLRRGHNYAGN